VLIVDTGPLVATADRDDADHAACRAMLEGDPDPLVTTALVIAEVSYLIDRQLGPQAEAALYSSIIDRSLDIEDLTNRDWGASGNWSRPRAASDSVAPTRRWYLSPSGWERHGIATLTRRHFTVVASRARRRLRAAPVTPPAVAPSAPCETASDNRGDDTTGRRGDPVDADGRSVQALGCPIPEAGSGVFDHGCFVRQVRREQTHG
jgi:predicted nucleic acid-binding protein